jgi:uncharacterized sulfatase
MASAGEKAKRLNVLFIIADDLNCHLGCYGNKTVKSPNIDRIASLGVRFERAYCQYALCNPSRSSFLSGRRPETTGVVGQVDAVRDKLPRAIFLPQLFRENAWFVAGAGKVFHSPKQNDAKSWDVYEDRPSDDPQEIAAIKRRYDNPPDKRTPDWAMLDGTGDKTMDGRTATRIAELMRDNVKQGKLFFLAAGFKKPHLPWAVPRTYFELYPAGRVTAPVESPLKGVPAIALMTELTPSPAPKSRTEAMAAYYAAISFADSQVGRLLKQLDDLNLWDTTIVVLIGDNGFHLGDHEGLWSKLTNFEEAARVPMIVVAPGFGRGTTSSRPVELLDLFPTLAELCGLARPDGIEGASLVPLLRRPDASWDRPAHTLVYHKEVRGNSVRTERWRLTEWDDGGQGTELYDHDNDPGECNNLANDPSQRRRVEELRKLLKR